MENAFGILAQRFGSRFGCLLGCMNQKPDNVTAIVKTCVVLHNLIRMQKLHLAPRVLDWEDEKHEVMPGLWRSKRQLQGMEPRVTGNQLSKQGKYKRFKLTRYFVSDQESVPLDPGSTL